MNVLITFYKRKLNQLKKSFNIFKLKYFYHYIFYDKKLGNIGFDFSKKKSRLEIVQDIINKKNYKNYLEIGCDNDVLFNHVNCQKKVGVDPVSGGTVRETPTFF